ncbi:Na+/H+ antiporter NhaA, partial [Aeromonas veronii]|uniref:Na+/H+ antiporter NhaA n=1 Tax=Aeromonas veronii TaxID=654 RepID=UPI00406C214F
MADSSFGESSASIRWSRVAHYLRTEPGAAVLLVIVTVVALVRANSPLSDAYFALWHLDVGFNFGPFGLHMDLHHWVNDGLMVVFFFLIGLEVRQEFA